MKKYDLLTINNYINGLSTDPFTLEELEDDTFFMECVLRRCKDIKMYDFASKNVKEDYKFISSLFDVFSDDVNFLENAVSVYLSKETPNPHNSMKLLVKLNNLIKNYNGRRNIYIPLYLECMVIENWVSLLNIESESEMFLDMIDFYANFPDDHPKNKFLVVDFYAEQQISSLLGDDDLGLEKLIHFHFNKFSQLKRKGFINFFIERISASNPSLANYIRNNVNLLDCYVKSLKFIEKNWDVYNKKNEEELYQYILNEVHNYVCYDSKTCVLTEYELLAVSGKELGITEKLKEYDTFGKNFYDKEGHNVLDLIYDEEEDFSTITPDDRVHIDYIKSVITDILSCGNVKIYELKKDAFGIKTHGCCRVQKITDYAK